MTAAQTVVLERLATGAHSASMLALRTGASPCTAMKTLRALWRRGFVTPLDDRVWAITPKGKRRLARTQGASL